MRRAGFPLLCTLAGALAFVQVYTSWTCFRVDSIPGMYGYVKLLVGAGEPLRGRATPRRLGFFSVRRGIGILDLEFSNGGTVRLGFRAGALYAGEVFEVIAAGFIGGQRHADHGGVVG